MNMRDRLTKDMQCIKGRIDNWLDRYFPEFNTVFKSWEGKAALLTLQSFPLPQEITDKGIEGILERWKVSVKDTVT